MGRKAPYHRMSHYDSRTFTLYLDDCDNGIYKITPEGIDHIPNGTDGILFERNPKAEPFQFMGSSVGPSFFDKIIIAPVTFAEDRLTTEERRLLLIFWFLAIFFGSVAPTRPVAVFVGPKNSGKSTASRKIGMLLFGKRFNVAPMADNIRDFDLAVTKSIYHVYDNVDSRVKWFEDRVAVIATGGTISRRGYTLTKTLSTCRSIPGLS